jgi:ABC-type Mn2+/Zn2+ transport system ATPase subunit
MDNKNNNRTAVAAAGRPEDPSAGDNSCPNILASNLKIGYRNEVIVSDVSFKVSSGEAIALIGTNGSGKSTLLKTIVGLLPVIRGSLSVFGTNPGKTPRRIAYLGQFHTSGFILPLCVIDVVRMGRFPLYGLWRRMGRKDDEIVRAAIQAMGIEKLADLPLRALSGGQQQRTYLAQVLAHQADLLSIRCHGYPRYPGGGSYLSPGNAAGAPGSSPG